jgi:hypothetical protein
MHSRSSNPATTCLRKKRDAIGLKKHDQSFLSYCVLESVSVLTKLLSISDTLTSLALCRPGLWMFVDEASQELLKQDETELHLAACVLAA